MTVQSYTGFITTETFATLASKTSITFAVGSVYSIQIQNIAEIKVGDAEFTFENEKFNFKQGSEDLYIKTTALGAKVTVLENEEE